MAFSIAKGLADMSMPQYDAISTSNSENHDKELPIVQEDQDPTRGRNKLNEDASPLTERSANKPSVQLSAVPNASNLFELLIKRVESAAPSEKADISRQHHAANVMDDGSTRKEEGLVTNSLERVALVNGTRSVVTTNNGMSTMPNGRATEQDEVSSTENISNINESPGRSIFEHLRKNFRLSDNNVPTTYDKLSSSSENRPTQGNDVIETTRSTGETELTSTVNIHKATKMEKGNDYHPVSRISGTHPVHLHQPGKTDLIVISSDKSQATAGQSFDTVRDDVSVFPFTQRLKLMSQHSREGSPTLPQQLATEQLNGPCYHSNTQRTNEMVESVHVDVARTSGPRSHVSGFQPIFAHIPAGTSGTSGSGPVPVRLQNGTLTSSLSNATLVPIQIPKKDICVTIDPRTRMIEGNVNFNVRGHTQEIPGFSSKTAQTSAMQKAGLTAAHGIRQSIPIDNRRNLLSENTQSFSRAQSYGNPRQNVPTTLHSEHSQTFPHIWDRRPVLTSSVPFNHRVPGCLPFSSNSATSAFSSPSYHQQHSARGNPATQETNPRGNPATQETRNTAQNVLARSRFQPVRLEMRPTQGFKDIHYFSSSTNVSRNSLSCSESFPKSPDQHSINDRVFRPVSPNWTHPSFSSSISSGLSHFGPAKSTASDADRDEFSYACALHESANSPDIERMLGSESPSGRSPPNTPPSTYEIPATTTTVVSTSTMSALRFSDSENVRDFASFSDSTTTNVRPSCVSTTTNGNCANKLSVSIHETPVESSFTQTNSSMDCKEENKKRKLSINVIHKRLEPRLPSPVRDNPTSGDLYQDPSKLTREERALQRAMMRFNEMEMKNKVDPNLPKKKRAKEFKAIEPKESKESTTEKLGEKLSSSTWLLNVKRKQKRWLSQRQKLKKKLSVPKSDVKAVASTDGVDAPIPIDQVTEDKKKTKIKEWKLSNDNTDHTRIAKKRKKFMNEARKKLLKKGIKNTGAEVVQGDNFVQTTKDILKKKKKQKNKLKKLKLQKKLEETHGTIKQHKVDLHKPSFTVTSGPQELPPVEPTIERKKSTDERHRVISKTYMLIPSYQGFKDFQPIVIQSRTRNKRAVQSSETVTVKEETKPKVPLLVIESVKSKPVKEMVVAENEEVQKLVTECLRVQGKWHGDELEQALKREEAELKEEVIRFRDAKKLSVNRTTGETILHKSARLGYDEIVKQCILQGANPNAKDNAGWTPLHEACARGKLAVVKVLARYGADVNSQSNDGIRPIHDAAEAGHVDAIRVLLSYGADPFLVTYAGLNALACAKHPRTKQFLQEYCIDIGHPVPDIPLQEELGGWEFSGSSSILDGHPEIVSGIWDSIPDCSETFSPEFEISDRPHLNTYNLPVIKDGTIVGRRNYLLLQELYQNGHIAKTTIQKKLKNTDLLEIPWSEFLGFLSENQLCVKPSFTPEGTSADEPKAQLVPLNYTIRKLLGVRVETCRC